MPEQDPRPPSPVYIPVAAPTRNNDKGKAMMKRAIVSLLIAGLGFFAAACDVPEDSDAAGSESKGNAEPDMTVPAKRILKDFENNEAAADSKYKGKTLKVTGVVDKVDTEFLDDEEYVVQVGSGAQFAVWTVNCDDQSSKAVSSLKKGDDITVVGGFEDGGDLGVELEGCRIL